MGKFVLGVITLWVLVYTISYGVYEYKNGSKKSALGIAGMCIAICVFFLKI